jgi:hypothetical protein
MHAMRRGASLAVSAVAVIGGITVTNASRHPATCDQDIRNKHGVSAPTLDNKYTYKEADLIAVSKYRPSAEEYERIDWTTYTKFVTDHALHDTLYGDKKVEVYEVYKHKTNSEVVCILKFGSSINGYPGIVHGGITALALDNSYGMLFFSMGLPPAFTANLDINYRYGHSICNLIYLTVTVHLNL